MSKPSDLPPIVSGIEQENLAGILNAMADGVYIVSAQHEIRFINPALQKEFGPVKGRKCYQYFHDRNSPCPWCKNDEVLAGKSIHWEWYSAKAGKTYDLLGTPLRCADGSRLKLEIFRDISELKKTQKKLQASHRFLQIANRHSEMKALLNEFVDEIRAYTGCSAVGMRILDRHGNIPFAAYTGFSRQFIESESPLSIENGTSTCIKVVSNRTEAGLPVYSAGGSFYVNGTSRFLRNLAADGRNWPCPVCNTHGYESVALVPIRLGGQVLGLIHVADKRDDRVPHGLVRNLEDAALQLGAALKRVLAEEELRLSNEELERRVKTRTAELARSNIALMRQVAEREQAEAALRKSEKELRLLSGRLLVAEEKERKRMARELHDGIGQTLSAIKFGIEKTLRSLKDSSPRAELDVLGQIIPMTQKTIEEVRRIVKDLRPSILDDLGILATITWFCREFETLFANIRIDKKIGIAEADIPERLKTVIYRILQEAFNNVAKHSQADRVVLQLEKKNDGLVLIVSDNGSGFETEKIVSLTTSERGFGLASMRERTELTGGRFSISSAPDAGTVISIVWPLTPAAVNG